MSKKTRSLTAHSATSKQPTNRQKHPPKRTVLHASLESQLVEALLTQLPFRGEGRGATTRDVLFARYLDSLEVLKACRNDLVTLCEAIATSSIQYDTSLPASVQNEVEQTVRSAYRIQLDSPANIAGAELGALPIDEIRERLCRGLEHACQELIQQFIDGLDAMVNHQQLGLAHWTGQNAVKYRFYQHRVGAEESQTTSTVETLHSTEEQRASSIWIVTKQLRRDIHSIPVTIARERRQHDAIDATCSSIEDTNVVIPARTQLLVSAIPQWMTPSVRILGGYLIRERTTPVNSKKVSVVTEVSEKVSTKTELRPLSEFVYGYDPAVLLGRFVLNGWGPREIEAAEINRQAKLAEEAATKATVIWCACFLGLQLLTGVLTKRSGGLVQLPFFIAYTFAALTFIASVFFMAFTLRKLFARNKTSVSEMQFQSILSALILFFFGLQLILLSSIPYSLVIGLLFAGIGLYLSHRNLRLLLSKVL